MSIRLRTHGTEIGIELTEMLGKTQVSNLSNVTQAEFLLGRVINDAYSTRTVSIELIFVAIELT